MFKTKEFHKWAKKEKVTDDDLLASISELERGLFDGDLGKGLFKKRIAQKGHGKRSSFRTILAYKKGKRVFFLYAFAKNKKANISNVEKAVYQKLAEALMMFSDLEIQKRLENKVLFEILRGELK